MAKQKRTRGSRNPLTRLAQDRNINVITRSGLITAWTLVLIYIALIYSENHWALPKFLEEIKFILGGLVIVYALWHTVNFLVAKYIIKTNK